MRKCVKCGETTDNFKDGLRKCRECYNEETREKTQNYIKKVKICNTCGEETDNFRFSKNKCIKCEKKYNSETYKIKKTLKEIKTCVICEETSDNFRCTQNTCIECSKIYRIQKQISKRPIDEPIIFKRKGQCKICGSKTNKIRPRTYTCYKCQYHKNPNNKIKNNLRSRTSKLIKNETGKFKYLCATVEFLMDWLEYNFDDNMNWNNYGTYWEIDHIIPCASFDFSIEENKYKCFAWFNIRPLEKNENATKGDKILPKIIKKYEKIANSFLELDT